MSETPKSANVASQLIEPVGLTDVERHLLSLSADLWNTWCSLPARCDSDDECFQMAIHTAQHLIALRVARRVDPGVWRQPITAHESMADKARRLKT